MTLHITSIVQPVCTTSQPSVYLPEVPQQRCASQAEQGQTEGLVAACAIVETVSPISLNKRKYSLDQVAVSLSRHCIIHSRDRRDQVLDTRQRAAATVTFATAVALLRSSRYFIHHRDFLPCQSQPYDTLTTRRVHSKLLLANA